MKSRTLILIITILLVLVFSFGAFAGDVVKKPEMKLTGFDVSLVMLEKPHEVLTDAGAKKNYYTAFMVRLHGDFPVTDAKLMRLYFGERPVEQYGSFPGGIYFMVYEKGALDKLGGLEVRYSIDGGPLFSTGKTFTLPKLDALAPIKEIDGMKKK